MILIWAIYVKRYKSCVSLTTCPLSKILFTSNLNFEAKHMFISRVDRHEDTERGLPKNYHLLREWYSLQISGQI